MEIKMANTASLCPVCLQRVPARHVRREDGRVYLEKSCPQHGSFDTLVWEEGSDFFAWDPGIMQSRPQKAGVVPAKGCPYDCGLCEAHKQAACCVLIEITRRCNQHCPVCFAATGQEGAEPDYTLGEMRELFQFLQNQSPDRPFNIQLSGGEPTVHPELPAIIRMAKELGFPYVQVNSNGRRFAEEPGYAVTLKEAGLDCLFLQFDGTSDDVYERVRGEKLLEHKRRAIQNSAAAGIGVVLVVTVVPGVNDGALGDIIRFAAAHMPGVTGVHLQPVSYFGRYPETPQNKDRITLPGLLGRIERQTDGAIQSRDFVPLASGHGRCSFHGNFLVKDGAFQGLSVDLGEKTGHDIEKARAYLARKWGGRAQRAKPSCCSAKTYDSAQWQAFLDELENQSLSITAMAFQDAWTVDLERLGRCRLHVATRDKRIIPFCARQMTNTQGEWLQEVSQRRF